ncbi:hypothetical protein [Armatimonas sp.]|uniref:hypothetical protein n=1 Tax=Armatimonas sp. TaxID=1872638 RepID=UPI00286B2801|nr:hypothetical protein [Armatimonas sp.]
MIQKQNVRDLKPLKEQLRARLQGHFTFPETVTEGWDRDGALVAIAELLDEEQKKKNTSTKPLNLWQSYLVSISVTLMMVVLTIFRMFREGKPPSSFQGWLLLQAFCAQTVIFLLILLWEKRKRGNRPQSSQPLPLSSDQRKLVQILEALLVRVDEVRLVPQVLEAARRVPELPVGVGRDTWKQAEAEALARLLPRMTTSEIQALPETQRIYLRGCLEREVSEDATVAILLTLASAQDASGFVLAQHYMGSASSRVQLAAQECLAATKI